MNIAIHGAGGRMGLRLITLASADPELEVVAALDAANHPRLGEDAGAVAGVATLGISLTSDWDGAADVLIDFSLPEPALKITRQCVQHGVPLVLATTGFDEGQRDEVRAGAETIPLLWAPNMSLAVNLTMKLAEITATALAGQAGGVDVEILERHHRFKEDAPSGTALAFGEIIARQMGQSQHQHGREGRIGARTTDEIGYHAIRVGDNPGEHTIVFGMLGETVELRVAATNRDAYAHGALAAAKFLHDRPAGMYAMKDVLGL